MTNALHPSLDKRFDISMIDLPSSECPDVEKNNYPQQNVPAARART